MRARGREGERLSASHEADRPDRDRRRGGGASDRAGERPNSDFCPVLLS